MPLIYKKTESDTIDNADELYQATINSLAVFFNDLPAKFAYDIKILNSVTTADGVKQNGGFQKVPNGTDAKGNTKYKNVNNKFVVMTISFVADGGIKKKIEDIVLAPLNTLAYNPSLAELQDFTTRLPHNLKGIIEPIDTAATTKPTPPPPAPPRTKTASGFWLPFTLKNGRILTTSATFLGLAPGGGYRFKADKNTEVLVTAEEYKILTGNTDPEIPKN